jgi:hypothetical protein
MPYASATVARRDESAPGDVCPAATGRKDERGDMTRVRVSLPLVVSAIDSARRSSPVTGHVCGRP